jgi:iron complex outermembrane receptor protein
MAAAAVVGVPDLLGQQNRGVITGKVVLDSSGEPLHHAMVLVIGLGRSVQSEDDGTFRMENVPPGKYEVLAHMHALSDERRPVVIQAGETVNMDFRLRFAVLREEVVVTSSGKEETTLETFLSSKTVDTIDMTLKSATSLGDVIENEAGVAKRTFGPGTSRPVIRGFDGDRVLILQDGVRTGTLSSQSGDHGEPVDPNSLERVEIVRGPSTLLYEGNAIGGVVNVITGHHQIHRDPKDGIRGFVTGIGGNNNNRRGGSGGFEYGIKNWLLFANGGTIYMDDYKTPLGTLENSRSNIKNGTFGIGNYGEKLFFNFSYGLQDGRYGIPFVEEEEHEHEEEGEEHEEEEEGHHAHENITLPFRRHNLRFNGGVKNIGSFVDSFQLTMNYSDWKHRELEGTEVANQFFNKQFIYRGVFDQQQRGKWNGTFGFWGMRRDYEAIGEEANTPPVDQNAFAVYAVEGVNFERFRLQFGGRVEHSRYNPEAQRKRSFTGAAGSVGGNFRLWQGGSFVANVTSSFRAPALEELYANGPHAGNLTFEIGDDALRRERGNGIDFSLRHSTTRFRAEANYFSYWLNSYVFLAPTGEFDDDLPVAFFRQGDSRYQGAESRLSAGVHPNLWLHGGLDYVRAELTAQNLPIPRIPPLRGRVGAELRWRNLSVMPELLMVNQQDRVYTQEDPTAGYAVVNLKAIYSMTTKHTLHLFGFNLGNATDRLYRNHLSFIKSFAPEMGRGVLFTYTMRFF